MEKQKKGYHLRTCLIFHLKSSAEQKKYIKKRSPRPHMSFITLNKEQKLRSSACFTVKSSHFCKCPGRSLPGHGLEYSVKLDAAFCLACRNFESEKLEECAVSQLLLHVTAAVIGSIMLLKIIDFFPNIAPSKNTFGNCKKKSSDSKWVKVMLFITILC